MGMSLVSYAVNVFLFASGRLALNAPPILRDAERYTDPLPQALVLTAIVISFGMTAVVVMIAVGSYLSAGDDLVNDPDLWQEPRRRSLRAEEARHDPLAYRPSFCRPCWPRFMVLAARYHLLIQRVLSVAGTLALLMLAVDCSGRPLTAR